MRTFSRPTAQVLACVAAVGLFLTHLTSPTVASAQDQPVVFIHGLLSDGSVWNGTANYLASLYQITPYHPTLGWDNAFSTQASNLETDLSGVGQAGAMGWSNGGLVERAYVQQFGGNSRINRAFTVGTPHHGAQLAQAVRDGTAEDYANYLFDSLVDPFDFYYAWDPDFQDAMDTGPDVILRDVFQILAYVAYNLLPIVDRFAVPVANTIPVGADMVPSSSFIASINSSANLTAEQSRLIKRVSSATGISPQNAFFTLFSNEPQRWGFIRQAAATYALLLYNYYSAHPDFFLRSNAWRWLEMYDALTYMGTDWLVLTGSILGVDQYGYPIADQQDGLVPLTSARWPGATIYRELLWPSHSIPHHDQITNQEMLNVMKDVLGQDFGIAIRPPPLQVSISGPTAIEEYQNGTWTAGTTGGRPPYTYQWTEDGYSSGTGGSLTTGGWGGGSTHRVGVVVTDASYHTASASFDVYVTYSNGCIYPPCPN